MIYINIIIGCILAGLVCVLVEKEKENIMLTRELMLANDRFNELMKEIDKE